LSPFKIINSTTLLIEALDGFALINPTHTGQ